jgi:hypothetical protein
MSGPGVLVALILAAMLLVPLLLYGVAHGLGSHWLGP